MGMACSFVLKRGNLAVTENVVGRYKVADARADGSVGLRGDAPRLHLCEDVSSVRRVSLLTCNMRGCYCTFTLLLRFVFLNQAHVSLHSRTAVVQKHCTRAAKSRQTHATPVV